jgi:hypothetical protein
VTFDFLAPLVCYISSQHYEGFRVLSVNYFEFYLVAQLSSFQLAPIILLSPLHSWYLQSIAASFHSRLFIALFIVGDAPDF